MKETNMEHYRGEAEERKYDFGKRKDSSTGKEYLISCVGVNCQRCDFYTGNNMNDDLFNCMARKIKWLMSEYKPEPVLTQREKHFVECLEDGWLTKGEACNEFKWWEKKPRRERNKWVAYEATQVHSILSYAFGIKLPFITWEDEEPWEVADLRKLKALEYNPEDVAFKDGVVDETNN